MFGKWRTTVRLLLLVSLLGLTTIGKNAAATTLECSDCSYSQMQLKAWIYVNDLPTPASDTIYFVNLQSNIVRKFSIRKWYASGLCTQPSCLVQKEIIPIPVEEEVQLYVTFANTHPQISLQVPAGDQLGLPENGYEAVAYPQKAQNLADWVENHPSTILQDYVDLLEILNPFPFFNPSAVEIPVRVELPGGSIVTLRYNTDTNDYERAPGETFDASGNIVPETAADVAGGGIGTTMRYDFTNDTESLAAWLNRMIALGVPVTGPLGDPNDASFFCTSYVKDGRLVVSCTVI